MKNSEIAKVFQDIANLLEAKGENQFKIRAYQKVVRSIERLPVEVEQLVKEDRLKEVPGVGEAIGHPDASSEDECIIEVRLEGCEDEKHQGDGPED